MAKVMFQFRQPGNEPSLAEVCASFGLDRSEVDAEFGVIATDPRTGLYTILVDEAAAPRINAKLRAMGAEADPATGIFANPRIDPTDPPADS